jgi:hypothetical protein
MKQTAVEWLENQIMTSKYFYSLMKEINSKSTVAQPNIFEQAKEMERQQIIEAHTQGYVIGGGNGDLYDTENYYNTTFKNTEQ